MYFFLLAHVIVMLVLRSALRTQLTWKKKRETAVDRRFSVIIPMRNEEANVCSVLDDLKKQSREGFLFEVVVIDDHSTDATLQLAREYQNHWPELSIYALDELQGKKAALAKGVEKAQYPWIITIDADVRLGSQWLHTLSNEACSLYDLYILPLELTNGGSMSNEWQIIENESLLALTAATAVMNEAVMCNGANLMFTKVAYEEALRLRRDEQWASGDDLFLLEAIKKKDKTRICFVPEQSVIARTEVSANWLQQRLRWTGKTKRVKDKATWLLGSYFAAMNLLVLVIWVLAFMGKLDLREAFIFHLIKMWLDFFWIKPMRRFFNHPRRLVWRVLFFFCFPFYFVFIAVSSLLITPTWKGRGVRG
jgi:glycosyltransferase involved in cell wall biosynthesis